MATKKNLTVRLEPEMRSMLEAIAEHELRTLANQIYVFMRQSIDRYLEVNQVKFRVSDEGKWFVVPADAPEDIPF